MGVQSQGKFYLGGSELVARGGRCGFESLNQRNILLLCTQGWWGRLVRSLCAGAALSDRWGQDVSWLGYLAGKWAT
jgi:hypothetical protein